MKVLFGADIELGHNILEYHTNLKNRKDAKANIDRALGGEKVTVESVAGEKTLMQRYFKITHTPLRNSQDKIFGVAVFAIDITESKKSEIRYRRLYETSQDGIMARDLQGKMINCNQAYIKMLGYSKKELEKLAPQQILPEKWHEPREQVIKEVIETGRSIVFEREYRRKDGSIFPASVRTWRLKDDNGKTIGVWSIVRDITKQKKLQDELKKYNEYLKEIVEEKTKQLKDSERLAAIGQTAGMVGHDIRNPLQAIISDLYLANSDLTAMPEGPEKKGLLESLVSIQNNAEYINKIVADLQDFARPLSPMMEDADLKLIINELLAKNGVFENIEVKIKVEEEARNLRADSTYLNRIIGNLVNNAIQAMPKGGKLKVYALADKQAKDVIIKVEDNGVGISEEVKCKLFTPMFTTKSKGQGFGLAVVKRMTEALGGTVTFESELGKGTTFIIRLPAKKVKVI